ncbi:MAG: hypothetical protein WCI02_15790 [Planctomycetota bacterium]
MKDAGKKDNCPSCSATFVVPGESAIREREQQRIQEEQEAKEEAEREAQESLDREVELAETRKQRLREREAIEEVNRRKAEQAAEELRKSHSGYVYHVEHFSPRFDGCGKHLENCINHYSQQGWEYVDFNIFTVHSSPGCLGSLLGLPGDVRVMHLLTFKKKIVSG